MALSSVMARAAACKKNVKQVRTQYIYNDAQQRTAAAAALNAKCTSAAVGLLLRGHYCACPCSRLLTFAHSDPFCGCSLRLLNKVEEPTQPPVGQLTRTSTRLMWGVSSNTGRFMRWKQQESFAVCSARASTLRYAYNFIWCAPHRIQTHAHTHAHTSAPSHNSNRGSDVGGVNRSEFFKFQKKVGNKFSRLYILSSEIETIKKVGDWFWRLYNIA